MRHQVLRIRPTPRCSACSWRVRFVDAVCSKNSGTAAGIAGLQVNASGGYSPTEFNVCVYSSYGGSAPIAPDSTQTFSGAIELTVDVPASTIQAVPPTAFTSDTAYPEPYFLLQVYLVTTGVTTCTGTPPSGETASTLAIEYPVLNNISTSNIPEQNPNLTGRVPSNLNLAGQNFLGSPIGSSPSSVTSTVNYATTSYSGSNTALYVSQRSVRSSLPVNIPSSVTSLEVSVCNAATYTYCSASQALYLYALAADTGTVTANPAAPASSSVPVTLSSQFGATPFSAQAGAPGGLVTFTDGPTTLGKAKLLLDTTAQFLQIPSDGDNSTFTTNTGSPISSFVADFNQDGVPDSMFVDGSAAVFHIILGLPPYAIDNPVSVTETTSCSTILSAAVADFNNDGIPDIAFACTSFDGNIYYAMLGLGDGSTFATPIQITAPNLPYPMLAAADFNKDGKVDLVIASTLDSVVSFTVLTGDGTGHFTAGSSQDPTAVGTVEGFLAGTSYTGLADPYAGGNLLVGAVDENGDGYADLLCLGSSNNGSSTTYYETGYITAGTASATLGIQPTFSAGAHTINATTPGTYTTAGGSASTSVTVPVTLMPGTITLTATPVSPATFGAAITLTAQINGTPAPTGVVTFADGATTLGTASFTTPSPGVNIATLNAGVLGAATHNFTATYPGDANYTSGSGTLSNYVIQQATRTTTWTPSPASIIYGTALSGAQLDALSPVAGTFAYTPAVGAVLSAGTQTLTAVFTPANATDYKSVTRAAPITVTRAAPATFWTPSPDTITYGTALSGSQLDATSPVAGTFAYSPASGAVLAVGTQTLTAVFTPTDAIDYQPVTISSSITVTPASTSITWVPNPATIVYGTALSAAQLDATSAIAGSFTYNLALGAVLTAGTQTLTALFTPMDAKDSGEHSNEHRRKHSMTRTTNRTVSIGSGNLHCSFTGQARRLLACSLIFSVVAMNAAPMLAQTAAVSQAAAAAAPMALHIEIIEGDDALNNIRERTAREPIIQVEDENHKPVAGAAVLFLINGSDTGAGGSFGSLTSFSTVTGADGRAVAHGFIPNTTSGKYTIAVSATVGTLVASALIHESNIGGVAPASTTAQKVSSPHHGIPKWVLVSGAVAVAAGIIVAVVLTNGGSHSATITPGSGTVGVPSVRK